MSVKPTPIHKKKMSIIQLVNQSEDVSEIELEMIAQAIQIQLKRDFGPAYRRDFNDFSIATIDPKVPCEKAFIVKTPPKDEDGVEGFHYLNDDGTPAIVVFTDPVLQNGGSVLNGPNSVSITASHEFCEDAEDKLTNLWLDTGNKLVDPHGKPWKEVSDETCDPVEDQYYDIDVNGIKVSVSNFILPDWSNINIASAKRDFLGKLPQDKPFGMSQNGYLIVRDRPGHELDIFAETYPTWKLDKKRSRFSRSYRRRKLKEQQA
jgi:hypothetical protein